VSLRGVLSSLLKADDRLSLPKFDMDKIVRSVNFTRDVSLAFKGYVKVLLQFQITGFSLLPFEASVFYFILLVITYYT